MKALLLLPLVLASCAGGASVTRTAKGGYHATSGYTLLARRQNVIAEVSTKEGDVIRYSTVDENSTEVANTFLGWWGSAKIAKTLLPATLKGTEDVTATTLGAQEVEKTKILSQEKVTLGEQALKVKP